MKTEINIVEGKTTITLKAESKFERMIFETALETDGYVTADICVDTDGFGSPSDPYIGITIMDKKNTQPIKR
jgi:hypothetical protein